jgi:hypothetical protein
MLSYSFRCHQIYNSQCDKSGHAVLLLTSNLDAQQTASENKGSCLALLLGVTKFILFWWPCSWNWDEHLQNTKIVSEKEKKIRIIKKPVCPKLHSFVEYLQIKPLTSDGKIPLVIITKLFFFVNDAMAKKARVFVPNKRFQLTLIFSCNANPLSVTR